MELQGVEEIKTDLNKILTRIAEIEGIKNIEIVLDSETNFGDGFVGQFYKGQVKDRDTEEVTKVAIKKSAIFESIVGTLINESLFYEKIYPELESFQKDNGVLEPFDNVPKYFCGRFDTKWEYLAMEDLKALGFVMFDKTQCFNEEHFNMLFNIYGKYHATSFVLQKKNLEKYQNITKNLIGIIPESKNYVEKPIILAISAVVNALDPEKDRLVYEELKDFGKNAYSTFEKATKYNGEFRCILHGDCWSNNMLFKYSESGKLLDIKLVDFQLCHDGSPIHDLSYFFYSGGSKEDFDNLNNYLQIYYKSFSKHSQELGANADEIISFEELKREWKENALFGVIFGIYLYQFKLLPKEDLANILTGTDGDRKEQFSVESWDELANFQAKIYSNEIYKIRTTDVLRHAYEYDIINKERIVRN